MNENDIREWRLSHFRNIADSLRKMNESPDAAVWPPELKKAFANAERYFETRTEFFQIALCGLFQSGKSTTANAIADGRRISASSSVSGIRTSACNIYFFGSDKALYDLRLIDDEELSGILSETLRLKLEPQNLWKPETETLLWNAFLSQWHSLDEENRERGEQLEQVAVILANQNALPALRAEQERTPFQDILRIGQAPDDERLRWARVRQETAASRDPGQWKALLRQEFPAREVLYPFVNRISVSVDSAWMKQTNICVVDMPGLGASQQDTKTALRAVKGADALMYIFNGDKQPDELERHFIRNLPSVTENCPVIFSINWRRGEKQAIVDAVRALLQESGYGNEPVISYNALFSCLSEQGARLLENKLDSETGKHLILQARENGLCADSVTEAWSALAANALYPLSRTAAREIERRGLCTESLDEVRNRSGWKRVIHALSEKAGGEQWLSIFRRQIRTPVETYVDALSKQLSLCESAANAEAEAKKEQAEQKWSGIQSSMQSFSAQKEKDFRFFINENWIQSIAEDMWHHVELKFPSLADVIADMFIEEDSYDLSEKASSVLYAAFTDWKKKFLRSGGGTPLKVLLDAAQLFERADADNPIVKQLWEHAVSGQSDLQSAISYELNKNARPLHYRSSSCVSYLEDFLKTGGAAGLNSRGFHAMVSVKSSWNPFINREQRLREARESLSDSILSAIRSQNRDIRSRAVRAYAKDADGQPQRLYRIANGRILAILKAAKQEEAQQNKSERKQVCQTPTQGKYSWNRCRVQLNQMAQRIKSAYVLPLKNG